MDIVEDVEAPLLTVLEIPYKLRICCHFELHMTSSTPTMSLYLLCITSTYDYRLHKKMDIDK